MKNMLSGPRGRKGFSLIEVMVAVVILSFGLLALAALQASLFRAGAEAKARENATAIAQQVVEDARTFAFVTPPTGYTGYTYQSLDTGNLGKMTVGGVEFTTTRTVSRWVNASGTTTFQANAATTGAVTSGTPEFKMVTVSVSWSDEAGNSKSVEIKDAIAAIAPSDAAQVAKKPGDGPESPKVWIEPPNKDNPQVVPIAVGGDQSSASSNPKPQQFVQDVSAATVFSVMTFTGSSSAEQVLLNRKLDVAAVSCVCSAGGVSTLASPKYQPAVWSGLQLAYLEPRTATVGSKVGTPVVSNSTPEIKEMCTVCCRDHHDGALNDAPTRSKPRTDPWRLYTAAEVSAKEEHYGYPPSSGNGFQLEVLRPLGEETANRYIDSCQLIRVGGRMRLAVDPQQSNLLVTPITGTTYDVPDFVDNYSKFVTGSVKAGITQIAPTTSKYPSPAQAFPVFTVGAGDGLRLTTPISLNNPGISPDRHSLIAFGLYVDYLTPETLAAYKCAYGTKQDPEPTGCEGQTQRNPLETIPFYAVNVANLGEWRSRIPEAIRAQNTVYTTGGLVASDGGLVRSNSAAAGGTVPVTLRMSASASGLASTFPVDPDDARSANFREDSQDFSRSGGDTGVKAYSVVMKVEIADSTNLSKYNFDQPNSSKVTCEGRFSVVCTVTYNASKPLTSQIQISNYNSEAANDVVINRRVCISNNQLGVVALVSNDGAISEGVTLTVPSTFDTLGLAVVDGSSCPTGYY